ncbi:hypothetical protein BH10PLA2_BH10PLA2_11430 [soil metagenome]
MFRIALQGTPPRLNFFLTQTTPRQNLIDNSRRVAPRQIGSWSLPKDGCRHEQLLFEFREIADIVHSLLPLLTNQARRPRIAS